MKKLSLALLIGSMATVAAADEYQFLGAAAIDDSDAEGSEATYSIGSIYYFEGQPTLGPLDQFSYIDDTTNVRGIFTSSDDSDVVMVGGSYYFSKFAVGADYFDFEEGSLTRFHADYFIMDNFKASVVLSTPDEGDDVVSVVAQYDHSLNDSDYIGFTAEVMDDEASTKSLSSKYFNALAGGSYVVVEAELSDDDFDSTWALSGKYYFNKMTGIELGSDDGDYNYLGASHYFTTNFALAAEVGENDSGTESVTEYYLEARLQF